jgi:glycosyltransferase involved in cell wall biosynthesis
MKEIQVLRESGIEISVISWIKGSSKLPSTEDKDGINVQRVFLQPPRKSFLRRVLAHRKITREISRKIVELKPNAIVCHDLEMLSAGVKGAKALNVPLFYDAHENWPEMVALNSRFEAKGFAILEKRLLRHVTHSYTYGDDLTEKFKGMGFPATTLFNSKSIDAAPSINEGDVERMKNQLDFGKDDFIIGFAGAASLENGLQQTIDCLNKLPENIKFLVAGGSVQEENLEKARRYAAEKEEKGRVVFTGRIQSDALLRHIAAFDVGTALFQPLSANEIARVPNKLFDYMSLSVPMIVSDFPNMRKIVVEESDCGLAVNPMDIEGIAKAVMNFYEHPDEAGEKAKNGRKMFEKVYCWDMQKKKLLESHPIWRGEG